MEDDGQMRQICDLASLRNHVELWQNDPPDDAPIGYISFTAKLCEQKGEGWEAYERWWEARKLWGQLVNLSRIFGRQVTTFRGVGSAEETEREAGIAHVLEHMLFKGTEKRGPGEIALEVEGLGGEINAFTSFDYTVYTLAVAGRYADKGIDLLFDALTASVRRLEEADTRLWSGDGALSVAPSDFLAAINAALAEAASQ